MEQQTLNTLKFYTEEEISKLWKNKEFTSSWRLCSSGGSGDLFVNPFDGGFVRTLNDLTYMEFFKILLDATENSPLYWKSSYDPITGMLGILISASDAYKDPKRAKAEWWQVYEPEGTSIKKVQTYLRYMLFLHEKNLWQEQKLYKTRMQYLKAINLNLLDSIDALLDLDDFNPLDMMC